MDTNKSTLDLRQPRSTPSKSKNTSGNSQTDYQMSETNTSRYESKRGVQKVQHTYTGASKEARIGYGTSLLMIMAALFFDCSQAVFGIIGLIPFIGTAISAPIGFMIGFFAWLTFYTWFKMHGVNFMRPQRILALFGAGLVELVPFLNVIPAWTFAVLFLIATTRIEDKTGINPIKLAKPGSSGNVSKAA